MRGEPSVSWPVIPEHERPSLFLRRQFRKTGLRPTGHLSTIQNLALVEPDDPAGTGGKVRSQGVSTRSTNAPFPCPKSPQSDDRSNNLGEWVGAPGPTGQRAIPSEHDPPRSPVDRERDPQENGDRGQSDSHNVGQPEIAEGAVLPDRSPDARGHNSRPLPWPPSCSRHA